MAKLFEGLHVLGELIRKLAEKPQPHVSEGEA